MGPSGATKNYCKKKKTDRSLHHNTTKNWTLNFWWRPFLVFISLAEFEEKKQNKKVLEIALLFFFFFCGNVWIRSKNYRFFGEDLFFLVFIWISLNCRPPKCFLSSNKPLVSSYASDYISTPEVCVFFFLFIFLATTSRTKIGSDQRQQDYRIEIHYIDL